MYNFDAKHATNQCVQWIKDWFDENGKVKPLFKDHSFKKSLPSEIGEFEECLKNIIERIKENSILNGITISGGEPLLQIDFILELFKLP